MTDSISLSHEDALGGMTEELTSLPVTTETGLGAIALNFALKYADTITCKDGTLYQQYKLEGKNLHTLHLDEVFHYAKQIEQHLLETPSRLAMLVLEGVAEAIEAEFEGGDASGMEAPSGGETAKHGSTEGDSPTAASGDAQ